MEARLAIYVVGDSKRVGRLTVTDSERVVYDTRFDGRGWNYPAIEKQLVGTGFKFCSRDLFSGTETWTGGQWPSH